MKLADRLSRLKWKKLTAALLVLVLIISLAGCGDYDYSSTGSSAVASTDGQISETENTETDVAEADETESTEALDADAEIEADDTEIAASQSEDENESNDSDSQDDADSSSDVKLATSGSAKSNSGSSSQTSSTFDLSTVPAYSGSPYAVVNGNVPYFTSSEITSKSFEAYSNLDALGRCGVAAASVGQDLMPTEARGEIGSVKPTGWHQEKYDFVDGKYVYNRCHLIAFELAGENANEKNLITGTRYMNIQGMLPFENMVADYVKETGNHVMYRVTPEFEGKNLVASGVLMEAESVEDGGDGILFCVYCYNVQPGVT
ncbi:MAG: DNA/RNA non-specific endonuclease, partial [Clostridiales bacterium]|nr:DNA/RNA non-specific endonuclease [Clostridiales bacterium]